jgi:hypothetical protein
MIGGQEYDFSYLEIGHFCHQLKKGNINMMWALLSPIVIYTVPEMGTLRSIVASIHTTAIVPSGIGMTVSQLNDVMKRADRRDPQKSLNTAYRTITFVMNHLTFNQWKFEPVTYEITEKMVTDRVEVIRDFAKHAKLPGMPVELIEEWLFRARTMD